MPLGVTESVGTSFFKVVIEKSGSKFKIGVSTTNRGL
jgi:hypothetical protein